jgi:hypothetical protein
VEPQQEKSPVHRRNTLPVLLFFALMLLFFSSPFVVLQLARLDFCSSTDRIVTPEAALAFGEDKIRQDKQFWESIGVTSTDEIESILNNGICCNAGRGDYFLDKPDHWRAYIGGKREGKYDFDYEVFFSECKKDLHVEILAIR